MKKKLITGLVTGLLLIGIVSTSHGNTIDSEIILTNPASTENLWSYSYLEPNRAIANAAYYTTDTNEFSSAVFEGYLTGNGVRANVDHFEDYTANFQSTRVFTTYIMSSIDQTVRFAAGGDDGHSIFVDDTFLAGAGYAVSAISVFNMIANQSYKLTSVGNNYGGHFELWFNIRGGLIPESEWVGPLSEARNISMDAAGDFAPVPVPSTMFLLGTGLVGLRRKKFKK